MSQYRSLRRLIHDRRKEIDLSQMELAKALHLETSVSVSRWENGAAPFPPKMIRPLARALRVPINEIVGLLPKRVAEEYRHLQRHFKTEVDASPTHEPITIDNPEIEENLEELHALYPGFAIQDFVETAVRRYLSEARFGLDANLNPIGPGDDATESTDDEKPSGRGKKGK